MSGITLDNATVAILIGSAVGTGNRTNVYRVCRQLHGEDPEAQYHR
jgi:hypothetical protein